MSTLWQSAVRLPVRIRNWIRQDLLASSHHADRHAHWALRFVRQITRKWATDRSPHLAALLAFQTILSIVPVIAVSFALLHSSQLLQARSALVQFISHHVLPVSGEALADRLLGFAENIRTGALGPTGLASTLMLAFLLFSTVEGVFNDIWKVRKRRNLLERFLIFYPLATLSPILIGISLYYSTRFWQSAVLVSFIVPLASTFIVLLLVNKLLPKCYVSWRAAALGALTGAILFELAKRGFQLYVTHLAYSSFKGMYGALGLVPLLILWVYYTWLVVLLGAEVSWAVQQVSAPARPRHHEARNNAAVDAMLAARLLLTIADNYANGLKSTAKGELADRHRVPIGVVEDVMEQLCATDYCIEISRMPVSYVPARPLQNILLHDVLELFSPTATDNTDAAISIATHDAQADMLSEIANQLQRAQDSITQKTTYADLTRPVNEHV